LLTVGAITDGQTLVRSGAAVVGAATVDPSSHASSHQDGGGDEIATATPGAAAIPKADGSSKLDSWISDAGASTKGLVQLATDLGGTAAAPTVGGLGGDSLPATVSNGFLKRDSGDTAWEHVAYGSAANTVCQGNDSRLSDARTPTAHDLGGAEHTADTLADVNTKVSDATLFGAAYGACYVSSTATTTTSQTPTYTKIAGTYTAGELSGFTHSAGVLTYTGSLTKKFLVAVSIAADSSASDDFLFRIAKNGTTIAATGMTRSISASGFGAMSLNWIIELATNDTLQAQVSRVGASGNLTNAEVTLTATATS
jgi:hypothetical protein